MIELLKENDLTPSIDEVYQKCKAQTGLPKTEIKNYVKDLYKNFTPEQISAKSAEIH